MVTPQLRGKAPARHPEDQGSNPKWYGELLSLALAAAVLQKENKAGLKVKW